MSEEAGSSGDEDVARSVPPERCLWCRLGVGCADHDGPPTPPDTAGAAGGDDAGHGGAEGPQPAPGGSGRPVVPGRVGGRPVGAVLAESEERVGLLAEAAPDGRLLALLLAVEPDEVDDYTAVEVVAAFRRVEAAAAAGAARAAAALAGRDSMHGTLPTRRGVSEVDHNITWANGGHTAVYNLAPLCEHDHPRKTSGGFTLEQPEPGTFVWTTPSGHRYRRTPDAHVTTLPRHGTPDDPPPF